MTYIFTFPTCNYVRAARRLQKGSYQPLEPPEL